MKKLGWLMLAAELVYGAGWYECDPDAVRSKLWEVCMADDVPAGRHSKRKLVQAFSCFAFVALRDR